MSGIAVQSRLRTGQVCLTRQGISLSPFCPFCEIGQELGPVPQLPASPQVSDHLILFRCWRKRAGVWSLRIPDFYREAEPFLLVFRTLGLSLPPSRGRVPWDPPGFPAYSRLQTARSPVRGAAPLACRGASYLRTVIVTAAVYRRLDSERRRGRSR